MRVIVTRPGPQAAEWVLQLASHGVDAVALPLIKIVPVADAAPLRAAWQALARYRLLFFVSPNAVDRFFAERPPGLAWPAGTLAASPGPGTTQVLVRHGLSPGQALAPPADAPQFDAEALWPVLAHMDWRGENVLIVRGDGGREGLATRLRAAGAHVDLLAAYRRAAPCFDLQASALLSEALARPADHLWFFSSSEAIDHLLATAPGSDFSHSRAFATHPRIAARARECGFLAVAETRPTLEAVVACIQSTQP